MALPFSPLPGAEFNVNKAAHLLWRAGFGGTWEEVEALAKRGLNGAVDWLVKFPQSQENSPPDCAKPQEVDDHAFQKSLVGLSKEARNKAEQARRQDENSRIAELRFWWLNRMLTTGRPLEEKMTLFWHGHFATSFSDKIEHAFPMWQQNQMFRRNALVPFPDMLNALICDPAMLVYLDNASSGRGHPNENFAREIMELHSLGVGNYTESDVKAAARGLTGWSVNRENWTFVKNTGAHDDTVKTYLGQSGNWDGGDIVRIITEQPACARFIAGKLFEFFVYERPEPEVVEAAAGTLRGCQYDLSLFLTTLFSSRIFYSKRATDAIVKSPIVLTIGALKSMRVKVPQKEVLADALREMGQNLFFPPDVNGWPGGIAWINSNMLLVRYNFANYLLNGVSPDEFKIFNQKKVGSAAKRREFVEGQRDPRAIEWNPRAQLRELGADRTMATSADIVDYYIKQFLSRQVAPALRNQLLDFAETDAAGGRRTFSLNDSNFDERVRGLVHLMMSSPDYQLC